MPYLRKEAKERQGTRTDITAKMSESEEGESRQKAAELFGIGSRYISYAEQVKETESELFKKVEQGHINCSWLVILSSPIIIKP